MLRRYNTSKVNDEFTACSFPALHLYISLMIVNNVAGKAQANAAALLLGGIKGNKQVIPYL